MKQHLQKPRMRIEFGQVSLLGNRTSNQDRCSLFETGETLLMVLGDGMGGHPKGEQAASILIDTCDEMFRHAVKPFSDPARFLTQVLHETHRRIVRFGKEQSPPIRPSTTAVVAMVQDGTAFWCHVGDSRCYLFRGDRLLHRTQDHSYVERLRSHGIISKSACASHPQRNHITRCLGGPLLLPEVEVGTPVKLEPNDLLLLCSDGFWSPLSNEVINRVLSLDKPLKLSITQLAHLAENRAFPDCDNITALGCRWLGVKNTTASANKSNPDADTTDTGGDSRLTEAIDDLQRAIVEYEKTLDEGNSKQ
jgi:serine/threonine protein phosphatase PrpC